MVGEGVGECEIPFALAIYDLLLDNNASLCLSSSRSNEHIRKAKKDFLELLDLKSISLNLELGSLFPRKMPYQGPWPSRP